MRGCSGRRQVARTLGVSIHTQEHHSRVMAMVLEKRHVAWNLAFVVSLILMAGQRGLSAAEVDFASYVRPILSDKCYACHGPDAGERQGGDPDAGGLRFDTKEGAFVDLGGYAAIVPGKPGESELVSRITTDDESLQMPPSDHPKQLTADEKKILSDWVAQGAVWKDHWAYIPPERYPAPEVTADLQPRNFIDAFILAKLQRKQLTSAPAADKRTLLRRLSFDIVGLPPTVEETRAFLADDSPEAYEKCVDRLLASPHFGERMAMHWLDLVRYADSVGYHGDQPVSVSPYRDYVINAFNANMPFDQFTREQLAGDLLEQPTQWQLIASGYNRLGMMSAEGGVQPKEYLAKYAADRVRTAAGVWMGSTFGCAECHDHKFDPFTSKDFYRFASFFADIKEKGLYSGSHESGRWGPQIDVPDEELPQLLKPLDAELAKLQTVLDTPLLELATAQTKWEQDITAAPQWQVIQPESAAALHGTKLKILDDQAVLAEGASPSQNVYTLTAKVPLKNITGFRLEVLPDPSLPQNGPGRAGNGNFVLTEFRVTRQTESGEPTTLLLKNATANIEQEAGDNVPGKKWLAAHAIDGDANSSEWGWAILPRGGQRSLLVVETSAPLENTDDAMFTFVLEQRHSNPNHTLGKFRLSVTDSPAPLRADDVDAIPANVRAILKIAADQRSDEQKTTLAAYYRSIAPELAETRQHIAALKKRKAELTAEHTRTTLVTVAVEPRTMRVLTRGNWMDESGEVVQPGVPHFLRQIREDERASRKDLADWLTARDNPLTARVFVNRVWQLYFGTGLSKVLDDLGAQGEPPSHPELLDTLAVEFMESGWDVKHLIKLIVMSDTYRQSSLMRPELAEVDPYNRLLARQSRFRLDAELVRDNALAVSGLLVDKLGGRSVKPYQPAGLYRHLNFPTRTYEADTGENQYRRGVYTHWQRQFLHPAMKAFDAPAREECTAQRTRSNTPLGALVLLNDPSYVEAARAFAARVISEGGATTPERIDWMINHALSRPVEPEEAEILTGFLQAQLQEYQSQPDAAKQLIATGLSQPPENIDPVELAAWTAVARAVFNMHEFITRN